jgi:hypothetical protein
MNKSDQKYGHPIKVLKINRSEIQQHNKSIERLYRQDLAALVIKSAFTQSYADQAVHQLLSTHCKDLWTSPNQGMPGGELKTIGAAATPTFTAFTGPNLETYASSSQQHQSHESLIFGNHSPTPTQQLSQIFTELFQGKTTESPSLKDNLTWLPFNYRSLEPGVQIYSHHDQHYRLPIYEAMSDEWDRSNILSWFVTLQPAQHDGKLILYGLWGSDPNIPMLPTRFIDTEALEKSYCKEIMNLSIGDLVIFDSGHHVHRVSPVKGSQSRITIGGFMTLNKKRDRLAFWS